MDDDTHACCHDVNMKKWLERQPMLSPGEV